MLMDECGDRALTPQTSAVRQGLACSQRRGMPTKGYAISGAAAAELIVPCAAPMIVWFAGSFIAAMDGRILVNWWSEDEA